jgi:hypothetical protein
MDDRPFNTASRTRRRQPEPDVLEKVVVIPDGMPLIDLTTGIGVWVQGHIDAMCAKTPGNSLVIIVINLPFEMLQQVEGLDAWHTSDQSCVASITVHSSTSHKVLYDGSKNGLEVHILAADTGRTLISYGTSTVEVMWASLIAALTGVRYSDLTTGGVRRPFGELLQRIAAIDIRYTISMGLQLTATSLRDVLDNNH